MCGKGELAAGLCPLCSWPLFPLDSELWQLRLSDKYEHIRRRQKTIRISLRKDPIIRDYTTLSWVIPAQKGGDLSTQQLGQLLHAD
jgi:hypothetical protein